MTWKLLAALCATSMLGLAGCSGEEAPPAAEAPAATLTADQLALKVDPFCGMSVEKHAIAATFEYEGKTYGFCSEFCRDEFAKDPKKWLANVGQGGM